MEGGKDPVSPQKKESVVFQSCLTLWDPMDFSPPGSSIHGILQARILEWVPISFSRGFSQPRDRTWVSRIAGRFFTILTIQILYRIAGYHQGSPRILEWVAYPFSSRSSQPRNPTRVSCIAGWFFTNELSGKPLVHFLKILNRKTIVNWSSTLSKLKKYSHWFFNLSRKIDCVTMPEQVSNKPSYHQWLIPK